MKLHEFKAKWMSRLALYEPRNERERELRDLLINSKLNPLRLMTLPNLAHTLYLIVTREDVSDDLKELCLAMLRDIQEIEGGE
ncbi:MAG: hypothetical protein DRJ38_04520 [Thermoprotei archaeon]|nr:MAG: hypothetical protein DRJ38_04520 [Thermoprotei archaeon]